MTESRRVAAASRVWTQAAPGWWVFYEGNDGEGLPRDAYPDLVDGKVVIGTAGRWRFGGDPWESPGTETVVQFDAVRSGGVAPGD